MQIVVVTFRPPPDAERRDIDPGVLVDILWASAAPDDGLEHIRARADPRPGDLSLALLLRSSTEEESSTEPVRELCGRAIASSPALTGWTVSTRTVPLTDLADFFDPMT